MHDATATNLADGFWHHIVMTKIWYNSQACVSRFYVDGGALNGGRSFEVTTPGGNPSQQDDDGTIQYLGFTQNGELDDTQFIGEIDLLHLQLPGDGHYFVALVPRRTGEQPPRFSTLGDGAIIRVDGTFGHDYVFAHDTRTAVQADAVAFDGTAGSVQDRPSGLALALGAAGTVRSGDYAIAADSSAGIAIHGQQARVTALPFRD